MVFLIVTVFVESTENLFNSNRFGHTCKYACDKINYQFEHLSTIKKLSKHEKTKIKYLPIGFKGSNPEKI